MDKKIIIAHVIGKWLGGGVESVVMNYYRNIDKNKFQFHFLCDSDSTNIPYEEIEALGGKVILIPPYQNVIKYHRELKRVLKENNYKIIHSHINTLSVFPLFAAKRAKVNIRIAHSHSTTNKKEWKKDLMKQALKPFSKTFATDYFCCSETAGRWQFGNKTYDNGKVYVLNNAIDLDKFKYNEQLRKEARKELGIMKDTLIIGHIGRFMTQKNHSFLIDVFKELKKLNQNSSLLLVGQGPLEKEIKEKVITLGLQDSVKFLGQKENVHLLYQAMDIFLLPSLYEGLGMVAIEAQTAGLPCILSSEVPSIAKVTKNVQFLELNDAEKWAKETINLVNNHKRGNDIKSISEAGYDINKEVKKLEDKYEELIK